MEEKGSGSLLARWKAKRQEVGTHIIKSVDKNDALLLSYGQQRLWLLQQLQPENPFYNYAEACFFEGELNIQNLYRSLQFIYDTHDILRTTYRVENDLPIARIGRTERLQINEYDLSSKIKSDDVDQINSILLEDSRRPFDLEKGPIVRFSLYKLSIDRHILLLNLHHIATDEWSMNIFRQQLATNYRLLNRGQNLVMKKPEVQYQDYASWQRKRKVDSGQMDYWFEKLSGDIPVLELPRDGSHPSQLTYKGALNRKSFDSNLSKSILRLSSLLETTPYVFLLSVYYLLLYRYTGQKDIIVGSPISSRDQKSLENLIGFFNNTLVLRTIFKDNISFRELVQLVRKTTLEALAHKNVPFEHLVKMIRPERSANTNPFFNVMFLYHSVPETLDFGSEIRFSSDVLDTKVAKFDLTLHVFEKNGLLSAILEYATDIFEQCTIERIQAHFELLLKGIVENPDEKIARIPMLSSFEEETFLKANHNRKEIHPVVGIHELISDNALNSPDNTAVTSVDESITYSELDKRAAAIARKIVKTTCGENFTVGLCMNRSIDMIVGLVGILKARCAYLPIDPDYPEERIKFMLQDTDAPLTITNSISSHLVESCECEVLNIDGIDSYSTDEKIALPTVKETDRAYVIYTSGSSGTPKGVPITHKNIVNSTRGRTDFYGSNPEAFLLMSSISFDSSKAGIFWTLCTGGNLIISEKRLEQDIDKLAETIHKNEVSHTLMLPSLYKMLLEHSDVKKLDSLKTAIVAGEACSTALCAKHFETLPKTNLYNEYGPTEATVWCIAHKIEKGDTKSSIPIGKPVAGATVYLLNKNLDLVPYGARGEIYIGGPGLSGVYLNRPDLTDSSYLPNPFDRDSSSKIYKTGDLGRYNSQGNIEFLGRADDQVKIRGFRIELEEIESIILQNEEVSKVAVLVEENSPSSQKRLAAFLKVSENFDEKAMKSNLRSVLPGYMVPSSIIVLDEFPYLPNGKIDKTSLSRLKPLKDRKSLSENDLPNNEKQVKLKKIWEEVLGVSPIGINDNFFEIGGDSISSIQIIARSRKEGIQLKPNQIFEYQTIAELELFAVEEVMEENHDAPVEGHVPLTPIQHWFFDIHKTAPNYWNQIVVVDGISAVSMSALKRVVKELVGHHSSLRSSFKKNKDVWEASILPEKDLNIFYYFDISNIKEKTAQEESIKNNMIATQKKLDLSKGGLFMGLYFDCGQTQENRFMMIAHHLVIDLVSWNTIFSDFRNGIKKVMNNEKISFSKKKVSIRAWADCLIALAKSPKILDEAGYWQSQEFPQVPFPTDYKPDSKTYAENTIEVYQSVLDFRNTKTLQNEANKAYNTKVEDLLISALFKTITDWSNSDRLLLGLERHGRNAEITDLDVSNTVGWFTSFFPIVLEKSQSRKIHSQLISVKEKLRSIPNDGIGYGILQYLSDAEEFELGRNERPQIIFNYLGNQNSITSEIGFEYLLNNARDPMSERTYGLELNAFIEGGVLKINWSYSTDLYKESTISKLVSDYENNLVSLLEYCCTVQEVNYTPSDFPEADLSQDDLDSLLKQLE